MNYAVIYLDKGQNSDLRQQLEWGLSEDYAILMACDVNEAIGVQRW